MKIVETNVGRSIVRAGLPYALSIFATSVLNGLVIHRHRHMSTKAGLSMQIALINAIYDKSLSLSPEGKSDLSNGKISNLMSVDSQKIYEVAMEGHLIWSLPLSILLVGYFLLRIIGISALSGIATHYSSTRIRLRHLQPQWRWRRRCEEGVIDGVANGTACYGPELIHELSCHGCAHRTGMGTIHERPRRSDH